MKHNDDATLQVLNMTGNDLREVGAQAFSSAGLLNLQRVFSHFSHLSLTNNFEPKKGYFHTFLILLPISV